MSGHQPAVSTATIRSKKPQSEKIVVLTAYDALFARLLDESGVDIVLVGDSLANVVRYEPTTLSVTLEEMIYHGKMVRRTVHHAMVVVDMPFLSYQISPEEALRNCGRVLQQTGAEAVKLEGGLPVIETVRRLTSSGIPVMGHLGLTPQSIHQFGNYAVRGTAESESQFLLESARQLEAAGAFSLVLEKIPAALAKQITDSIGIPTIGIGAGPDCDGQVLVLYDMLGLYDFPDGKMPKFVRRYASLADEVRKAVKSYGDDVRNGRFPDSSEKY